MRPGRFAVRSDQLSVLRVENHIGPASEGGGQLPDVLVKANGKRIRAMAYIMTPGHQIVPPNAGYLATSLQGYEDFGFDPTPLIRAASDAEGGVEPQ